MPHPVATEAVLALDQGSHASRACVYARDGRLLAVRHVPVAMHLPVPGHAQQDALELAASLQRAAGEALAAARTHAPQLHVVAAGLAVQRSTIVCAHGADCEPLGPALSWQDRRNAAWLAQLAPDSARVRSLTGLPLSAHYGASKLRWCLEHWPDVRQAARHGRLRALPLAAWLHARLTGGEPACDAANASRTLLFDTTRLQWSEELLALFGLPALGLDMQALPRSVPTGGEFGALRVDGESIPLRALTGDQSAVPFADGALPGEASLNLGTGAFLQLPLAARPADPSPLLGSVLGTWDTGTLYSLEGTVNGAGAAVSAFCAREGLAEHALWPALEALPEDAPLPDCRIAEGGLGSPWWQAGARSDWPQGGTAPTRFAAVVEAVALLCALNVEALAAHGVAPAALRVAGGLSRSPFLCRRLAAFTGLPVRRAEAQATARGAAALAVPEWARAWRTGGAHDADEAAILPPDEPLAAMLAGRRARLAAGYEALARAAGAAADTGTGTGGGDR